MAFDSIRKDIERYDLKNPSNLSLLYNRLCPKIDEEGEHSFKDLRSKMRFGYSTGDTLPIYKAALKNWRKTMESDPDTTCFEMKTISPLVIGMGDQNVHEFGIALQLPWGTPVIPGTSIKGVLSSFAHRHGGSDWNKGSLSYKNNAISPFSGKYALVMFGGNDESEESFAGCLDFFDAWWVPGRKQGKPFAEDIINVHNRSYYQGQNDRFPDGMDNPLPNKFVVVKPGEKFFFAIKGAASWRNLAKEMLISAAKENGFGAKTRVGYGRLEYCKGVSDIIDDLPDMDDEKLAEVFEKNKGNAKLKEAFAEQARRRKYSPVLRKLFMNFRPAACFLDDIRKVGMKRELTWKDVRNIHENYRKALKKIVIDKNDPDVRAIYEECKNCAPKDFKGTWFEKFVPSDKGSS